MATDTAEQLEVAFESFSHIMQSQGGAALSSEFARVAAELHPDIDTVQGGENDHLPGPAQARVPAHSRQKQNRQACGEVDGEGPCLEKGLGDAVETHEARREAGRGSGEGRRAGATCLSRAAWPP